MKILFKWIIESNIGVLDKKLNQDRQTFSVKDQRVCILGFMGQISGLC